MPERTAERTAAFMPAAGAPTFRMARENWVFGEGDRDKSMSLGWERRLTTQKSTRGSRPPRSDKYPSSGRHELLMKSKQAAVQAALRTCGPGHGHEQDVVATGPAPLRWQQGGSGQSPLLPEASATTPHSGVSIQHLKVLGEWYRGRERGHSKHKEAGDTTRANLT